MHGSLKPLFYCGFLAVICSFGCQQQTAIGDVPAEGDEPGGVGAAVAMKARFSGLRTLRVLWGQRRTGDITPRLLSLLQSPSETVRSRAVVLLGRLEDPRALKPLESLRSMAPPADLLWSNELVGGTLYPELQFAIGRIKARRLSGRRKLDTMLAEAGLSYNGVAAMSRQINTDNYGYRLAGFRVIEDVVRVLADQKRSSQNINSAASALTLLPEQKALLQAVSPVPSVEADRLLLYMARTRGNYPLLTEQVLDLPLPPNVVLAKISAKLQNRKSYRDPFGLVDVVRNIALQKNRRAYGMLQVLAKDATRPVTRSVALSALNQLKWQM